MIEGSFLPLLDFNIREALELEFLSGAVCQTKES